LAAAHGYRFYLELCAATTGHRYGEVDRRRLSCRRLSYLTPDQHKDGGGIDYQSPDREIGDCLARMARDGFAFDIALVDPWHEYGTSWRDLNEAFRLLPAGGTLVVHDCLPDRAELTAPAFTPGEWCGRTFEAYVDFVHSRNDLTFYTVDCDYGCGVIRKKPPVTGLRLRARTGASMLRRLPTRGLRRRWREAKQQGGDALFAFFQAHRVALLNLISVDAFLEKKEVPPSASP
jgi:hypothetical protein